MASYRGESPHRVEVGCLGLALFKSSALTFIKPTLSNYEVSSLDTPSVKRTEASLALGLPSGWTWHGTSMCHRHGMPPVWDV